MSSEIRDVNLAESGEKKIEWVKRNCDLLRMLEEEFSKTKPFAGKKVALSVHLEAKTAYLCKVLAAGGAEMYVTGSNPLSTQDDIAAALVADGLNVFAWYDATEEEYFNHIRRVLEVGPDVIIDDGGDLVHMMHTEYTDLIPNVLGGCEETTTGILRLEAMDRAGKLRFPMVRVNNADCKHLFDNRYGTGQSVWDGVNRTTNLIVAGKNVVVAGYGWCGKGVAMRAKGLGAKVIVTEVDPIKAIEAIMDGFQVMKMVDAAPLGDFFLTVTGDKKVITEEHFAVMKDKAILANAGHFDVEIDKEALNNMCVKHGHTKPNIEEYHFADGRKVYLLGEGRLVNLAAGDGHPAEIMDLTFALQALSLEYVLNNPGLANTVHSVPKEIDERVAKIKLQALNVSIDALTAEQQEYLSSWQL